MLGVIARHLVWTKYRIVRSNFIQDMATEVSARKRDLFGLVEA